uniref:L domain-like protein n=1 Tax=Cyclophora tenuis TaxID=216820 RepID=A0A7S1D506_CYCTE
MELFWLFLNQFDGTIPPSLTSLPNLTHLDLDFLSLYGTIPPFGGPNASLVQCYMASNQFSGNLGRILATLPTATLEIFDVNNNLITGEIPTMIGDFSQLQRLSLSVNRIRGTIPTEIGRLQSGLRMYYSDNLLVGTIPTEIGLLTAMEYFFVSRNNNINGTIPTEVGNMASLLSFGAIQNSLTGTLPTELANCSNLVSFGVSSNRIEGNLSEIIDFFQPAMFELFLGENILTGSIPTTIGRLIGLETLVIGENQIVGHLPSEIGQLTNFTAFLLANNSITGPLPSEIGQLTNLQQFAAQRNNFTGTLPSEMAQMTSLIILDVSENSLTGSPGVITELTTIVAVRFYDNPFDGVSEVCNGNLVGVQIAANYCDNIVFNCSCCTHCCEYNSDGQRNCPSITGSVL